MVTEIDEERSFINQLYILQKSKNGEKTYFPKDESLRRIDDQYLKLSHGDKVKLTFGNLDIKNDCKYYLISHGYYIPYGRANKAPELIDNF
ncbi:hypothetical protein D3C78_1292690 [compost metagenome]